MMFHPWKILPLAVLMAAVGCGEEDIEPSDMRVVRVMEVLPALITEEVYRSARLEGVEEALIIPAAVGRISAVLVSEGDSVKTGDPLVSLVTDRQVTAGTSAALAGINAARANRDNALSNLNRMEVLFDAGAVSEVQLDGARAQAEAASAQLVQAQAGYGQALSQAENCSVNAPFEGVVGRVWAREGNMAGGAPLVSISNGSSIRASVLLPERYLGCVEVGYPARVELVTEGRPNFPGTVVSVSPSVDAVSGMVAVSVEFPNTQGQIHPGQTARVAIGVAMNQEALSVPEYALRRSASGFSLAVVNEGVVSILPVETGIRNSGLVEIVSGISPGDRVLVSGQHQAFQGESVEVQE